MESTIMPQETPYVSTPAYKQLRWATRTVMWLHKTLKTQAPPPPRMAAHMLVHVRALKGWCVSVERQLTEIVSAHMHKTGRTVMEDDTIGDVERIVERHRATWDTPAALHALTSHTIERMAHRYPNIPNEHLEDIIRTAFFTTHQTGRYYPNAKALRQIGIDPDDYREPTAPTISIKTQRTWNPK